MKYALDVAHAARTSCLNSLAVTVSPPSKQCVICVKGADAGTITLVPVTSTVTVSDKMPSNLAVLEAGVAFQHPIRKIPMLLYLFPKCSPGTPQISQLPSQPHRAPPKTLECIVPFWCVGTTTDRAHVNMELTSITMTLVGNTVITLPVLVNTLPLCKGDVLLIHKESSAVRKFYGAVVPPLASVPPAPVHQVFGAGAASSSKGPPKAPPKGPAAAPPKGPPPKAPVKASAAAKTSSAPPFKRRRTA